MSDLFHPDVSNGFIHQVFEVMNNTPQHIYQLLTKRSERVAQLNKELKWTKNIWIGTSVEDERVSDRIDHISRLDANVKFLSCEPLIGRISTLNLSNIDWVIVGGESGHKARPVSREWILEIKQACTKHNIPFFFKQWGKPKFNLDSSDPTIAKDHPLHAKGGCQLDGRIYREMPRAI